VPIQLLCNTNPGLWFTTYIFSDMFCCECYTLLFTGLKFLVRLCTDLGLKDAQEYIQKLKKAEKARETKQQVP